LKSKRAGILILLTAILGAALACGPVGSLGDIVAGGEAGTAASLWSDVPPYPGASQVDLELPLVMRLAVEAASQAIMSGAGDAGGDLEFIAFTTGDSGEQIQAYYTPDRMTGEGWADREDTGCGLTANAPEGVGGMCAFYKEGQARDSILIIVAAPEDGGPTSIFYIRIDANPERMATAAAQ
jgi:hypothetical protein